MAEGAARSAPCRKGFDAQERRTGATAAGAAVGAGGKGLRIRNGRWQSLTGGSVPRTLAIAGLSLHVRTGLHGGLPFLLDDRRRLQRIRRAPREPRRDAVGCVAGATRKAAGIQEAHGLEIP